MKTISEHELLKLLANLPPGAHPIGFIALTEVDARRKGNPYSRVMKLVRINAMLGVNHVAAIERQQAREGVPEPRYLGSPRSWGERLPNANALVNHGNRWYIAAQLNPINRVRPMYLVPNEVTGRLRMIDKEAVAPWLPAARSQAEHQGVEREVVYRNYAITSITSIKLPGHPRYRVRHD